MSEHDPSQPERNQPSTNPSQPEQQAPAARPSRRGRLRGTVVSAFRGFVDDDPAPSGPAVQTQASEVTPVRSQTQNGHTQNGNMDVESREQSVQQEEIPETERKRSRAVTDKDDKDMEELFPAHAAAKRRKLEEGEDEDTPKKSKPMSAEKEKAKIKEEAARKKKQQQLAVQEAARKRREKEEEANREDEEPMQEQLAKMTVDDMQSLAVVEEMEVSKRGGEARRSKSHDDRWDDRWNGRKNFKKFRHKGQQESSRRAPTVIVALEEVRDTRHGIQDDFFTVEKPPSRKKGKSRTEREDTTPSQSFADAPSHQEEVPVELLDDNEPEVIDVDAPRATRTSGRASQASVRTRGTKRPTADNVSGTSKRPRRLNLPTHSDDSSEPDEIPKFRFKRK